MAREHRPNICGGTYHVMNRGNRKALIFEDERDRKRFVRLLIELSRLFEVEILGGCLMGNHFHLLLLTPRGNLSQFMQQLEGQFADYSNWRHQRVGHLFQGRFRSVLIENDIHLLIAVCYVFMNPVVAGFCARLEDWKWSTYAGAAGFEPVQDYVSIGWVETLFPASSFETSQRRFRDFMNQARPVNCYLEQFEWGSGNERINQVIRSYVGERLRDASIPRLYQPLCRPPLEALLRSGMSHYERDLAIYQARAEYGYKCGEIAQAVALRRSTVGNIVRRVRRTLLT